MLKSKVGVSPPRQSSAKPSSREKTTDKIQIKINEYESQLQKIRDDIFKLHVELFQISSPAKKAIIKPILQNIEKVNQEYELTLKKYDLSQNLVQTFQSIIDMYPIGHTKIKKQEKNKPLSSASSNVVKPHIKQYIDFTKNAPFEKHKTSQRVVDQQHSQLKRKIDIYQNNKFPKPLAPSEEKEIRTKRDFIGLLEKDLIDLKKANDHLIRRFGTNSGFRVSSQLKYGQKINKTLKDNLYSFQHELNQISDQIRKYESTIDSLQEHPHYNRMINEGTKYKETTTKRVNELLQEASDRVKLGQKILASIERIASLLDPNHLSSGLAITELQWIMQQLSKLLHKGITESPIKNYDSIWDLTKTSTLKIFDDENSSNINNINSSSYNSINNINNSNSANINENDESFPEIPEIPIMSMLPMDQSLGNTRQTRRLFSALSSLRSGNDGDESVDQSLRTLGVLLGNVFVDRFSPLFHRNDNILIKSEPETVFLPKPLSKIVDLNSLLQLYVKYQSDINMTQLENDEIQQFDPDFLSFCSEKEFFKENLNFSTEEFIDIVVDCFTKSLKTLKTNDRQSPKKPTIDDCLLTPCLWMCHDFATNEAIPHIIQKMTPIFKKVRKSFIVSNPNGIVAWAATISSFFRCHSKSTKEALLSLFDPIFPILLDKYSPKIMDTPQVRCVTLALLRYGKHYPREFMNFTNLKNNATSCLHNFIQWNLKTPTFVKAAIEFAKSALMILNGESLTWHTSLFYHYLVTELMPVRIQTEIVKSFLSILCSIIESRDNSMTLLLKRIYFIYFLKKNFELEEIVSEKQDEIQIVHTQSIEQMKTINRPNNDDDYPIKYNNIKLGPPEEEEEEEAEDDSLVNEEEEEEEKFVKIEFEPPPVPKLSLTPKGMADNKSKNKDEDDNDGMPYVPPIAFNFSSSSIGLMNKKPPPPPQTQSPSPAPLPPPITKLNLSKPSSNSTNAPPPTTSTTDGDDGDMKMPIVPSISFAKLNENKNDVSKMNISYNDLSNVVSPIALNLDNPKLQLHFQKERTNLAPIRSSVSFSNSDYMSERKMYPIYLDLELHSLFVKTMFATLVDHSLNRFDVFFCDPFPFVNRKPNILFTLMQHMESSANTELKESLFDRPKETIDNQQSEDIPPIPPINVLSALKTNQKKEKVEDDEIEFNEPQIKRSLLPPVSPIKNKGLPLNMIPLKAGISTPKFFDQGSMIFDQKSAAAGVGNNGGEYFSLDNLLPESLHSRNEYKYLLLVKKKKTQANLVIAKRLMRLTMPCLFNKENYKNGRHIASGAFGSVMVCKQENKSNYLAVKILKKSKNEYDNPHLFEVFTEVSILEMCQNDRRVTQLNDYGCTSNSYYIIMEYYPTTLKAWRKKNNQIDINTLLRLYREFLKSCTVLADKHINHYDIKCDNVMVDKNGYPCLADFGESMCYTSDKNCFTMLNKGTEWIKSPEMLSIALNSTITNPNFDRRKKVGAGPESDVWSIGCLFYELVTGEFLFAETNWSHFFRRITESDQVLILPENKEKLPNDQRFCAFLEFVLQRNFRSRPNLNQVISKFDEMFPEALNSPLPTIEIPTFD